MKNYIVTYFCEDGYSDEYEVCGVNKIAAGELFEELAADGDIDYVSYTVERA